MQIAKQKPNTDWINESGKAVPFSMLKKSDKVNERIVFAVAKEAIKVSKSIARLKAIIQETVKLAIAAFESDYKGKRTEFKGNWTFSNYNDTIKVVVKVGKPVTFDDMLIQKAQALLKDFLNDGITAKDAAIKDMVMDAFQTTRGKMDVNRVMALKRYSDTIKDSRWKKAMSLIDAAVRHPNSKTYYQVWVRNAVDGEYEAIPLALADL